MEIWKQHQTPELERRSERNSGSEHKIGCWGLKGKGRDKELRGGNGLID